MKKIMDAYKQYEHLVDCHVPKFTSDASEFHVILWNQNYDSKGAVKEDANDVEEFVNEDGQFANFDRI